MSKRIFETGASFDVKTSRQKFNVMNREVKGAKANVLKTRSKAVSKRKEALQLAMEQSSKDNKFVDKRIGESGKAATEMTEEEKYFKRYQLERMNQIKTLKKNNKFALQDEEELTHMGQSLSSLSADTLKGQMDDDSSSDSDNEKDGRMSADVTRFAHFGGGVLEGERAKLFADKTPEERARMTKREIMQDIIMKSKVYKAERQGAAAEQQAFADELDKDFADIRSLLEFKHQSDDEEEEEVSNVGIDGKLITKTGKVDGIATGANVALDNYMAEVDMLAGSAKAAASNRLRTDEEIAKAHRDRLFKLEKARLKRMNPDKYSDDDSDDLDELTGWKDGESDDEMSKDPLLEFDDGSDEEGSTRGQRRRKKQREAQLALKRAKALKKQQKALDASGAAVEAEDEDEDGEDDVEEDGDEDMEEDGEMDEDDEDVADDEEEEEEVSQGRKRVTYDAEDVGGNLALDDDMMIHSDDDSDALSDVDMPTLSKGRAADLEAERKKKEKAKKKKLDQAVFELDDSDPNPVPFTFPAPIKYKEFKQLLDTRGNDTAKAIADHELIITRLRTLYNVKLGETDNQYKMECLYKHLYRHLRVLCEEETARLAAAEAQRTETKDGKASAKKADKKAASAVTLSSSDMAVAKLDVIVRQLFELNEMLLRFSTRTNRDFVSALRTSMQERLAGLSQEQQYPLSTPSSASVFPLPHEVMGMRVLAKIYPVSDYRHTITTPLFLVLAEVISTFPVRGGRDIAVGLFLCSMLLEFVSETKRYVPEVIAFLQTVILALFDINPANAPAFAAEQETTQLAPRNAEEYQYLLQSKLKTFVPVQTALCKLFDLNEKPQAFSLTDRFDKEAAAVNAPGKKKTDKPKENEIVNEPIFDKIPVGLLFLPHNNYAVYKTAAFHTAALNTVLKLVFAAAQTYAKLETFPEIFAPIYTALSAALAKQTVKKDDKTPEAFSTLPVDAPVAVKIRALLHQLKQQSARVAMLRKPLAKFARPVAMREYTPSFKDEYVPGKNYDLDKERAETKKLQDKLKRAKRDTVRQVRRDNQVLMQEKQRLAEKQEVRRQAERKRVASELQKEATSTNIMDQVSKKKRTI